MENVFPWHTLLWPHLAEYCVPNLRARKQCHRMGWKWNGMKRSGQGNPPANWQNPKVHGVNPNEHGRAKCARPTGWSPLLPPASPGTCPGPNSRWPSQNYFLVVCSLFSCGGLFATSRLAAAVEGQRRGKGTTSCVCGL